VLPYHCSRRAQAALDPFHNYFLLVDDGADEWGGEATLRDALEDRLSTSLRVPRLQLVVQATGPPLPSPAAPLSTSAHSPPPRRQGGVAELRMVLAS
jgi:hypothetical protein